MTPDQQGQWKDRVELAGFAAAVAGLGCLGFWLGGWVLSAALALLALAAALILVGNS